MTITAHVLIKNEARFVWYSIMSVVDRVDKIIIYDTGSTDGTREIIKEIRKQKRDKVRTKFLKSITPEEFPQIRKKMLEETKTDWFLVVDGDEIWWDQSIQKVVETIKSRGEEIESIVVPTVNLVGDIFHYQEKEAGRYKFGGRMGHYNLRGVKRSIPGLSSKNPHGTWGWVDKDNKMIQERSKDKVGFVSAPYLHASFLQRSVTKTKDAKVPKRKKKLNYEIGVSFSRDCYYPEVFFRPRPEIVASVWKTMTSQYKSKALIETPLRKINRRLFSAKVGY